MKIKYAQTLKNQKIFGVPKTRLFSSKLRNFWHPKKSEDFWDVENLWIFKHSKNGSFY